MGTACINNDNCIIIWSLTCQELPQHHHLIPLHWSSRYHIPPQSMDIVHNDNEGIVILNSHAHICTHIHIHTPLVNPNCTGDQWRRQQQQQYIVITLATQLHHHPHPMLHHHHHLNTTWFHLTYTLAATQLTTCS